MRRGLLPGSVRGRLMLLVLATLLPSVAVSLFAAFNTYRDERTVTIKGIDEADSSRGEVSWVSPIARALLKARVGDEVPLVTPLGVERVEVVQVEYPAPDLG